MNVLNMLNTKYFISQDGRVQQNPSALGNAWFISSPIIVKNADEEIASLSDFIPSEMIIIDKRYASFVKDSNYNINGVQNIKGDLLDFNLLKNSLKNIDFVYHLAAFADLDKAKDDPIKTMHINVLGTTNLLQAAKINQVDKVIFASSIYVNSRTGGFYRVSKHACEILLEEFYNSYKLNYTILRFGTIFGPRSDNSNSVYNYLLSAYKNKSINAIGSGDEVREYIDVRDAVKACEQAMLDKYNSEAVVVTGNHRIRLNELLEMIREILNNDIEIKYGKGICRLS